MEVQSAPVVRPPRQFLAALPAWGRAAAGEQSHNPLRAAEGDRRVPLQCQSRPAMSSRQYAGDFECADCRRKRLTAASFSKSMANKRRSNPAAPLRCLECVAKLAEEERLASLERSRAALAQTEGPDEVPVECSRCARALPPASFSAKQRRREAGARCSECIASAEAAERERTGQLGADALKAAQEASEALPPTASGMERLEAAAAETAQEATFVTGLQPVKLGGRGPVGSWRARGRGRGVSASVRGRP
jgi:hypothetical protein